MGERASAARSSPRFIPALSRCSSPSPPSTTSRDRAGMASASKRHSPLEALAADLAAASTARLIIQEVPFATQIDVRGKRENGEFAAAARAILEGDLPVVSNTFARTAMLDALWLGPDQWLLVQTGDRDASNLEASLRRALTGQHVSIVDVSDARAILELSGPESRDVLMQGSSLD